MDSLRITNLLTDLRIRLAEWLVAAALYIAPGTGAEAAKMRAVWTEYFLTAALQNAVAKDKQKHAATPNNRTGKASDL